MTGIIGLLILLGLVVLIALLGRKSNVDTDRTFNWLQNNISVLETEMVWGGPQEETFMRESLPDLTTIPRVAFTQFFKGMPEIDFDKCMDIMMVTDYMIDDYHDTKGHPGMSLEDYERYLPMSLEEIRTASRAIREIDFRVDTFLARGFLIPELMKYEYQLVYEMDFPGQKLIYLDRSRIFLRESPSLAVYER